MKIWLSPTLMDTYRQCKRCAYDQMILKVKRPRGAYPTLPNGIDDMLKRYTDSYRGSLPPELVHLAGYKFMEDQSLVNTYRQWNGLQAVRNVSVKRPTMQLSNRVVTHTMILSGGIDDILIDPQDQVVVFDFKTKGSEPPDNYGDKYYQNNMDAYAFMLKSQGYQVSTEAFLWYWWPLEIDLDKGEWRFGQKLLRMTVDPDRMGTELDNMAEDLPAIKAEAGEYRDKFPAAVDCPYCNFVTEKKENEEAL